MTAMIPAWVGDTLVPVEKLEVHKRGLRHKAVSVFVVSGDDVLIQRRALGKYHTPGLWANTCCTHPNWDEKSLDCAARRMEEELGVTGLSYRHRGRVEYRADVGGGLIEHEVVEIYLAEAPETMTVQCNPDEVMETEWVNVDTLVERAANEPDLFTPWLRIYLENYHSAIFDRPALKIA
ncbi:isopentenyl-diphosphate Delta-isomerase [Roseovarius sp. LXJ103]|uniref:isopentenyl-diphosphate Delta-isomerase n=1 Tax=Roseovarius carneus TaxID=2853164 RepID=UPI000D60963A|nr:isopentenyl-diphosphate Delta-isomerase [Roseovarius carneus]MBZ8119138.1 isopentenyl-diphosphate Delta-isomerase [Roseovarius carneus]PWE35229.1 isopentenyl-diphosphate delta-isomerase [Pelagicola sp. LXJ1103]